jgi:hypothetical protein
MESEGFTSQGLLHDLGKSAEISFVTKRWNGREVLISWLNYWLRVPRPQVVLCPGNKPTLLREMKPHIIIEDKLSTLMQCADFIRRGKMPPCTLILVDRPYNREGRPLDGSISVVKSSEMALSRALEIVNATSVTA